MSSNPRVSFNDTYYISSPYDPSDNHVVQTQIRIKSENKDSSPHLTSKFCSKSLFSFRETLPIFSASPPPIEKQGQGGRQPT